MLLSHSLPMTSSNVQQWPESVGITWKKNKKPPTIRISKLKVLLVTRIKAATLFCGMLQNPGKSGDAKLANKNNQSSRQEHPHPIRHSANQHMFLLAPFDFAPGCLAVGGLHTSARLEKKRFKSKRPFQVNEWQKKPLLSIIVVV